MLNILEISIQKFIWKMSLQNLQFPVVTSQKETPGLNSFELTQ